MMHPDKRAWRDFNRLKNDYMEMVVKAERRAERAEIDLFIMNGGKMRNTKSYKKLYNRALMMIQSLERENMRIQKRLEQYEGKNTSDIPPEQIRPTWLEMFKGWMRGVL
jgi:hypothetical protein